MMIVCTPGYKKEAIANQGAQAAFHLAGELLAGTSEPSWIVIDPTVPVGERKKEDEGRTLKVNGPFKAYVIRDIHEDDCDCGCGGGRVVTYMLPEEY